MALISGEIWIYFLRDMATSKSPIEPIFVAPSSLIALAPFRYLWNNPPGFVGRSLWLALLTPLAAFFVVALGISYLMTLCWRRWKSG
jgi:hypothetical protein